MKKTSSAAVDCIRQLPHLCELSSASFTTPDLRRLVEGGQPVPPLERIPGDIWIDATTVDLVLKLAPTLTAMDAKIALADIAPLLSQLQTVTTLDIRVNRHRSSQRIVRSSTPL